MNNNSNNMFNKKKEQNETRNYVIRPALKEKFTKNVKQLF